MNPEQFLTEIVSWAAGRSDIAAIALVGSHARGEARPDSDIDLVLVCDDPSTLLRDADWRSTFGTIERSTIEDWGLVQSIRTFYRGGLEVEFGITSSDWAEIPVDPGTLEVIRCGIKTLYDPRGVLSRLFAALGDNRAE